MVSLLDEEEILSRGAISLSKSQNISLALLGTVVKFPSP